MILPLLLTLWAPAEEEYPEPPSPCEVSWGNEISPRFIDGTKQRIARRCRELVDALDYDDEPGAIHIEVGGETFAFTVRVDLVDDGEVVFRQDEDGEVCEGGGDDLSAFAMKRVAAAINEHREPAAEPDAAPVPETGPDEGGGQDTPPPPPERHVLRWTGVTVGVAGAATLVAGAVLRPREETRRVREDGVWQTEVHPKFEPRSTAIMIGVGASAVGVGVGLIVADSILSKRRKRERTTFVAPALTPTSASITLQSRF